MERERIAFSEDVLSELDAQTITSSNISLPRGFQLYGKKNVDLLGDGNKCDYLVGASDNLFSGRVPEGDLIVPVRSGELIPAKQIKLTSEELASYNALGMNTFALYDFKEQDNRKLRFLRTKLSSEGIEIGELESLMVEVVSFENPTNKVDEVTKNIWDEINSKYGPLFN